MTSLPFRSNRSNDGAVVNTVARCSVSNRAMSMGTTFSEFVALPIPPRRSSSAVTSREESQPTSHHHRASLRCAIPFRTSPSSRFSRRGTLSSATAQWRTALPTGLVLPRHAHADAEQSCRTTARIVSWLTVKSAARERRCGTESLRMGPAVMTTDGRLRDPARSPGSRSARVH